MHARVCMCMCMCVPVCAYVCVECMSGVLHACAGITHVWDVSYKTGAGFAAGVLY